MTKTEKNHLNNQSIVKQKSTSYQPFYRSYRRLGQEATEKNKYKYDVILFLFTFVSKMPQL